MKKLMNEASDFVDQSLMGILSAHSDFYTCSNSDLRAIAIKEMTPGKVAIVTGGGYGHLPLFLGYVGKGLCDGVAVGNVFTSPSSDTIVEVSRRVQQGAGILYLFGNYTGDGINFAMAKELLDLDNIKSEIVTGCDDIASASRDKWRDRRGIAGIVFAYKTAGACAQEMHSLEEVKRIAEKTIANTFTFGVAFSSCTLPDVGKPIFSFEQEDTIEIGMGIHGEPGVERSKMMSSKELANRLIGGIIEDSAMHAGEEVAVLVNGLGATSREELYIFYNDVRLILQEKSIKICKAFVDEFATSMEMAGASVTLLRLDDELKHFLDAPAFSPFTSFFIEN